MNSASSPPSALTTSSFRGFVVQYLRPHRVMLSLILAVLLVETGISLFIPLVVGDVSAYFLNEGDVDIRLMVSLWVVLIVVQGGFRYFTAYHTNTIGATILKTLSCKLYDHIQSLPMSYFAQRKQGDVIALISNDVNHISYFMSSVLTSLIPTVLLSIGAMLMMWTVNVYLAGLILIAIPIIVVILKVLGRRIRPLSEAVMQRNAEAVAVAAENINVIETLKAYGQEQAQSTRFARFADTVLGLRKQQLHLQAILTPLMQLLVAFTVVAFVMITANVYQSGELGISELITLILYAMLFARPMSQLAGLYGQYQQALGSTKRILACLAHAPEQTNHDLPQAQFERFDIALEGVYFGYSNEPGQENNAVLQDISLHIEQGQTVMLSGDNGAGKTTLLHLIMRFLTPTQGTVRIGGVDVSEVDVHSYRRYLAMVSQRIALCDGTIEDNVLYGLDNVEPALLTQALQRAGVMDFANTMPQGLASHVGENGSLLSGGQRQKIALARALLVDSPIVLLDEPTAHADHQGFELLQQLLREHLSHKTVIVVSHDRRLFDDVDKVYALKNGQLSAIGSHID